MSIFTFVEQSTDPSTPASARASIYVKSGVLYIIDDVGTVTALGAGGGGGDVVGPASSTDNALARFDSTTGKLLQNGQTIEDDSGNVVIAGTLNTRVLATDASKLDGIEALADVTNATNVNAAGAVMETDAAGGGLSGTYPNPDVVGMTAGVLTDDSAHGVRGGGTQHADAVPGGADGFMTGTDKTKLDGIETAATADQSAAEVVFAPDGDIGATDVQAAIVEVRDETDTKLAAKAAGAASSTDNALARYDGVTGKITQNSLALLDDVGGLTGLTSVHVEHTATENDDRALDVSCDAAGFADVKAMEIEYTTGVLQAGEVDECLLINIDQSLSTGGEVSGVEVLGTSLGGANVNALHVGATVDPVEAFVGVFADMDSILVLAVDQRAALIDGGAGNVTMFVADNDTITIGHANQFTEMEILLDTPASGAGIAPTFEHSTGVGTWASFVPADGTNGFRNTGVIEWDTAGIAGAWLVGTGGEYLIRVTRTRNALTTSPIVDEVQIAETVETHWNKAGELDVLAINVAGSPVIQDSKLAGTYAGELTRTGSSAYAAIKHNITATTDPLVTSDSNSDYAVKSIWINVTLDTAWICVDATVGAAVWSQINAAGGGAGVPSVDYVGSLSSSNYMTAPGSAGTTAAGGENDFIVFIWHRQGPHHTSGNFPRIAAATGAWECMWNFGGLRFVAIDSAGTTFGPSNVGGTGVYGSSIVMSESRDALIMLRVVGGAGTPSCTVRVNGRQIADSTAANAGTPQTATAVMEVGGNNDLFGGVEGVGYVSGTLTDAQIVAIEEASFAAGGVRDAGTVMTWLWNSETLPTGGAWADQIGSDDMTETGTTTTHELIMKLA